MPHHPSDDDSDLGQFVPGLDGEQERRLRYQEKLKDVQAFRRQREAVKLDAPSDIFDFGIRQKERRVAIDLSSDDEFEGKVPEMKSSASSKKQRPRKRSSTQLSDSSDSDVVEISAFRPSGRLKRTKNDPLLKKIDFSQLCSESSIRQMQNQDPELRSSMVMVAETSKIIEEIRAPIQVKHGPISPVKTPQAPKLPDLISFDNVATNGPNSTTQLKIWLRILDPDSQFFTNARLFANSTFVDLYLKLSQFFAKIWLTKDDYEIDRKATPATLGLQDGDTIKIVIAKPSKGLYKPAEPGLHDSNDIPGSKNLKFCISGKQEISLKVAPDDSFVKIREKLCSAHGFQKIVFLLDGERIEDSESVRDLDLEDGDQIDIKVS